MATDLFPLPRWFTHPCMTCEGEGSYSDLAPCTTFDRDCACNGPRVLVDPCPACGGTGGQPASGEELASDG